MLPLIGLVASLVGNYVCHRLGLSTICSTLRRFIGPGAMTAIVLTVVGWFLPHYARPFIIRATQYVDDALADFDTEETP